MLDFGVDMTMGEKEILPHIGLQQKIHAVLVIAALRS
jgi:hypothetical protein